MNQRAARPGGFSTRSGRKFIRKDDGLPSAREVRELAQRLDASTRRSRCGRPGRAPTPEYRQRVLAKLRAASQERGGRGIRFLSRDELDAILSMIDDARPSDGTPATHEPSPTADEQATTANEATTIANDQATTANDQATTANEQATTTANEQATTTTSEPATTTANEQATTAASEQATTANEPAPTTHQIAPTHQDAPTS